MQKASMGARIGALLIDSFFISIICSFIAYINLYLAPFVYIFGTFLYYGICEGSSMSASLGKKICGIIVVDENGNRLTPGKAFLRSLCREVSSLILGIGYIMAFFDPDYKALHDKMAGTFVASAVPVSQPAVSSLPAPEQRSVNVNGNPQVIGMAGQFAGRAFNLQSQGAIMGRDSASCEFAFSDSTQGISRNHCKIVFNPQTQMFVLYDLGSSYGTFLSTGVKVTQGQPVALRSGDEFYLASRANTFRVSL